VTKSEKKKSPLLFRIGIVLLIIYVLLWIGIIVTPFLPVSTFVKATVIPGTIVFAEILLIIAVAFVGKEFVSKYKDRLKPKNWKKKKGSSDDE
jgi:hypothetical protein